MPRVVTDWPTRDLMFVAQTLVPERNDQKHLANLLREDDHLLEAMLRDDRLYRSLTRDDESFLVVSPQLFFRVLMVRALRDLEDELHTVEMRHSQKIVLFDAQQVVNLIAQPDICDYLAAMLASFTRIETRTLRVRLRDGLWKQLRANDLDVDSMLRYCQFAEEERRFTIYQRVGDACLFLTGIFPEFIDTRYLYPASRRPRVRLGSSLLHSFEDHESYGRTFYRLAARHKDARTAGLDGVLDTMSQQFVLAEKSLAFLANRYLSIRRHRLFAL